MPEDPPGFKPDGVLALSTACLSGEKLWLAAFRSFSGFQTFGQSALVWLKTRLFGDRQQRFDPAQGGLFRIWHMDAFQLNWIEPTLARGR
jgi:hypothetical protein